MPSSSRRCRVAPPSLRAVQTQLVAAEGMAAIGEVVAAGAHAIRNPLPNIMAEVDRLERR